MNSFGFRAASADERIVFGAQRPGYPRQAVRPEKVRSWIAFMQGRGIRRVCCLLPQNQLAYYGQSLLKTYERGFGRSSTCWAPVPDYHLCDANRLTRQILPFLAEADGDEEPVVVHCSAGIGRTGLVMAAWLAHGRGMSVERALLEVRRTGRNPYEAVACDTATMDELVALLTSCKVDANAKDAAVDCSVRSN